MSLQDVKADYVKEQTVLQAWKNRMDTTTEVSEVPPESSMSIEYREGWKHYLDAVLAISARMIAKCDEAANSGSTTELKALLDSEVQAYKKLANEAQKLGLLELKTMLQHEADSRELVIGEL